MRPFPLPVSGQPGKTRINEFLADLAELAVKHFPSRIDRTGVGDEDGYMIVTLKNGKAGSALAMSALADGIRFEYASVRWRLGAEAGLDALLSRTAGELLGILSGERILARIGEGADCRGAVVPRGGEKEAVAALRESAPAGEPVFLKSWHEAERRAGGEVP